MKINLFKTKRVERTLHGDINPSEIDKLFQILGITRYGSGKNIEKVDIYLEIKQKEE